MGNIQKVSFEEAKQILDTRADALLLDVREEEEYITGHAEGAILFTLSEINADSAREVIGEKQVPLLVYCRSGRRSLEAAQKLIGLGYDEIYDIGGLIGWPYGIC